MYYDAHVHNLSNVHVVSLFLIAVDPTMTSEVVAMLTAFIRKLAILCLFMGLCTDAMSMKKRLKKVELEIEEFEDIIKDLEETIGEQDEIIGINFKVPS